MSLVWATAVFTVFALKRPRPCLPYSALVGRPSECAVGRTIRRGDQHGGLDWRNPCPTEPGIEPLDLGERGQHWLCEPHEHVLLDDLEPWARTVLGPPWLVV